MANGGDIAKEAGILPVGAGVPYGTDRSNIVSVLAGPGPLYVLQKQWEDQSIAGSSQAVRARLLASDDLGNTWRPFPGGLPVDASCLTSVSMDYATRDALYASTCQGDQLPTSPGSRKVSERRLVDRYCYTVTWKTEKPPGIALDPHGI